MQKNLFITFLPLILILVICPNLLAQEVHTAIPIDKGTRLACLETVEGIKLGKFRGSAGFLIKNLKVQINKTKKQIRANKALGKKKIKIIQQNALKTP